jgi:hypothetical protein
VAVTISGRVRQWRDDKPAGSPSSTCRPSLVAELGGRRQTRGVRQPQRRTVRRQQLVAGGHFCVGLSRAALRAAGAAVGDQMSLSIAPAPALRGRHGTRSMTALPLATSSGSETCSCVISHLPSDHRQQVGHAYPRSGPPAVLQGPGHLAEPVRGGTTSKVDDVRCVHRHRHVDILRQQRLGLTR